MSGCNALKTDANHIRLGSDVTLIPLEPADRSTPIRAQVGQPRGVVPSQTLKVPTPGPNQPMGYFRTAAHGIGEVDVSACMSLFWLGLRDLAHTRKPDIRNSRPGGYSICSWFLSL
jgi:hypothetical protein